MNLQNIFNQIENTDPEIYERLDGRRELMQRFTKLGSKFALTAVPVVLGGMLNKAYSQAPASIVSILNFALTLEYLESTFYAKGLATSGLIPESQRPSFDSIAKHELDHVQFLSSTIIALGGTPVAKPTFDYTAKGTFPDVFATKDYATFLALSQTFEDTGVRAYKGQAGGLISNNDVLTAALQIHSVEARHASHIRSVRAALGASTKPWITLNNTGIGAAVAASYAGEENTNQLGVNIKALPSIKGGSSTSADTATEAFDEPLTKAQVLTIVMPFIQ